MEFPHGRLMAILTDPSLGVSAESIAGLRAHMETPGAAIALHGLLAQRDLSEFDSEYIPDGIPQHLIQLMHKHAPSAGTIRRHRGTHLCTIQPDGLAFTHKGRPLQDARVLSLHAVGAQALQIFAESTAAAADPLIYRKLHAVFLTAEDECTDIDLCDLFEWCKCSKLYAESARISEEQAGCRIKTHFGCVLLAVHVLANADEYRVEFLNGDKTVRIQVKHIRGFKPSTIGIGLHALNNCKQCKKFRSETVKLKECSRCRSIGINCFYCSRECQLLDYPQHRKVCTYDWSASDWRKNASVVV